MSPKYLWVFSQNIWPPPKFLIRRPPLSYGNISTQTKKKEQMNKNRSKRESPFFLSRDEEKDSTQITP